MSATTHPGSVEEARRGSTRLEDLASAAAADPQRPLLEFARVTYPASDIFQWTARGLVELGVRSGDHVKSLPRFAVPTSGQIVEDLPKTPSDSVAKGKVRERGLTPAAYDAEAQALAPLPDLAV